MFVFVLVITRAIEECDAILNHKETDFAIEFLTTEIESGFEVSYSNLFQILYESYQLYWKNAGSRFDPFRELIFYVCIGVPVLTIIFAILVKLLYSLIQSLVVFGCFVVSSLNLFF